jgi:hypothetical protein
MVFGSDYATRSFQVTFSLVVFCTSIMTFKEGLARVLAANSLLWWGFFSNTFWAAILIVSTIYLVGWGASGLAASLTIAYILNTVILVPLYYSRNLVPKGTLLSIESGVIWCIMLFLVFLNIVNATLHSRSIVFVPCMLAAGIAFKRIARSGNAGMEQQSR